MASLALCVEFVADNLCLHGGAASVLRKEQRATLGLPAIAVCLMDFMPVVIQAAPGEAFPQGGEASVLNFGGRGKALLLETSLAEGRTMTETAPLWLLALGRSEVAKSKVLASACLDLSQEIHRALAPESAASADSRSFGQFPRWVRLKVKLHDVAGTGGLATLECALRVSCIRAKPTSQARPGTTSSLELPIQQRARPSPPPAILQENIADGTWFRDAFRIDSAAAPFAAERRKADGSQDPEGAPEPVKPFVVAAPKHEECMASPAEIRIVATEAETVPLDQPQVQAQINTLVPESSLHLVTEMTRELMQA